jgi:phage/plasmid-like protein (TIGR03299 family)
MTQTTDEKIQDILIQTGLNWKAVPKQLQTVDEGILIEDTIALIRDDTKKKLGIHTDGYVPYQNDELLNLLFRIGAQTGLQFHSGGSFGDGEKVWFQLKSDDLNLPGGDKVKGFISGFNSFDGRTSLAFGNCNITVSCMNTFWLGYKNVDTKLRHSRNMKPRIEEILRKIDVLLEEEQQNFRKIEHLIDVRANNAVKDLVVRALFDISKDSRLDDPELSTNKKNKIERFNFDLATEIASKGDNLWGLFSGVTRYTTHSMKKGDNSEGKMIGLTGQRERAIWNELVTI